MTTTTPIKKEKGFELRVGQFNVLNLVKAGEKFYGNSSYSKDKVEKKAAWIGEQLKKMNCHIVGFEEVFHIDPLAEAVKASGIYPTAEIVSVGATGSGPTNALLTTLKVLEKVVIADFPPESLLTFSTGPLPLKKFSRPILRVVLELPNKTEVVVFVAHAKSKRPIVDDSLRHDQKAKAVGHALSLITRAAESAALRCIIVDEIKKNPKRPVMLIGDLNDTAHSVTTEIISGTRPWKKLPKAEKDEIWNTLLWSTNEIQIRFSDRDVTYTHIHNGRYEVLDHIFVSNHFVRANPEHIAYVKYLQLFNDHILDETLTDTPRTNIESDHGQVVAIIKFLPPGKKPTKPEYDE